MEPGGIVVGLVAFRLPSGHVLPLAVHYPNGRVHQIACQRCGDSEKFEGARCPSCRPAPSAGL